MFLAVNLSVLILYYFLLGGEDQEQTLQIANVLTEFSVLCNSARPC